MLSGHIERERIKDVCCTRTRACSGRVGKRVQSFSLSNGVVFPQMIGHWKSKMKTVTALYLSIFIEIVEKL